MPLILRADWLTCVCASFVGADNKHVGWEENSFGLHGDDGKLYSGQGTSRTVYSPVYQTGDVIGCGFDVEKRHLFWTINGES